MQEEKPLGWSESIRQLLHPRVVTMLFLGFSAGIPILLIFSSLSLWLIEAGVQKKTVTFFSWAALGYSFKFIWAPLIDKLPVPFLTRALGRRRAWLLISQTLVICAIVLMGSIDPASGEQTLVLLALAAVMLGFSSATQDIVVDAYRIESAAVRLQGLMSSTYVTGYRLAMIVAGAGALYIAEYLGSTNDLYVYSAWRYTYFIMASVMLVGVVTTLLIPEPTASKQSRYQYQNSDYLRMLLLFACSVGAFVMFYFYSGDVIASLRRSLPGMSGGLSGFLLEATRLMLALSCSFLIGWSLIRVGMVDKAIASDTWIEPVTDFFQRYGLKTALLLLALVGLYRTSDIVLGVISNVFYHNTGFSKTVIADAVKVFGVVMTIAGTFLGGIFATRFGVMRTLLWGAILAAVSNLFFISLSYVGASVPWLYTVVTVDNLAAGFATAAFIAFLSSLTNISFTAVQYAIFSSLMTLFPKLLGGYSGSMVEAIGYPYFFVGTTLMGLPVIILVITINRFFAVKD